MDHLFSRLNRRTVLSLVGLLVVGQVLASRLSFSDEPSPEVKQHLAELTETISELQLAADSNPLVREELASSYMTRAKVYLFTVEDFSSAVSDFTQAIDLLTAITKTEPNDLLLNSALAEGRLFRARSRMKLKQIEPAYLDASSSITIYKRLTRQDNAFESNLVFALKTRIEISREIKNRDAGQTQQLASDFTTAIELLEKLSKKGFNDQFYEKQLTDLRTIQNEISPDGGGEGKKPKTATIPSANQQTREFAARTPSDLPLGTWISDKEYQNNFALPLKVSLKGEWERSLPPGANFHVVRKDGMATLNPNLPVKTDQLDQAFILWMESFVVEERILLGIELLGLAEGEQFQDFIPELMGKIIKEESNKPGVLYDPISRFHQVIIAGRICWQLDIDVFRESGLYTRRNIYIPAGNVVYDIGWAMTEPRLRSALDDEFDLMIQIGAPFQDSPQDDVQAQQILSAITEAQKRSTQLTTLKAQLNDTLDIQGAAIARTQAFLNDNRGGSPFGIARRAGNNAGAITALQAVKQWQEKIDQLMAERLQLRRKVILESLTDDQIKLAKKFFPDVFRKLPAQRDGIQKMLFTSPDGSFEVDSRAVEPKITKSAGSIQYDFFLDNGHYRIARKTFPIETLKGESSIDEALIDLGDVFKTDQKGTLLKEEFSEVGDHRARILSWEIENQNGGRSKVTVALTIAEESLFLISTVVNDISDAAEIERADHFIQSFQIRTETAAKAPSSLSVPLSDKKMNVMDTRRNLPSSESNKPDIESSLGSDSQSYTAGQAVDIFWRDKWYPAKLMKQVGEQQWEIRYDSSSASWDEVVAADRIRLRRPPEPKYRSYGPEQLIGPPNTERAGDYSTAWASKYPDSAVEWILVEYQTEVPVSEIAIYETYNPGAVTKIFAVDSMGVESIIWTSEVDRSVSEQKRKLRIALQESTETKLIKIEIDSPAVSGWNEIDTVAVRDNHGEWHWPVRADASSSYSSGDTPPQLKASIHKE